MTTNDLIKDARQQWVAYGNALASHFGLPSDSQLPADAFEEFIQKGSESAIRGITAYLRQQAASLKKD